MPYGNARCHTGPIMCCAAHPLPCAEQKLKVEVCEVINLYMEK